MFQALKSLLGDNLLYIKRRREAYIAQEQGMRQVGETWGVVITRATGLQSLAWRDELKSCLSGWQVTFDDVIALFI